MGEWREGRRGVKVESQTKQTQESVSRPLNIRAPRCFKDKDGCVRAASCVQPPALLSFLLPHLKKKATNNASPVRTAQRAFKKNAAPALLRHEIVAPATRSSILVLSVLLTASLMCVSAHLLLLLPPMLSCPPSSLPHLHILAPHPSGVQSCVADGGFLLLVCGRGDAVFCKHPCFPFFFFDSGRCLSQLK